MLNQKFFSKTSIVLFLYIFIFQYAKAFKIEPESIITTENQKSVIMTYCNNISYFISCNASLTLTVKGRQGIEKISSSFNDGYLFKGECDQIRISKSPYPREYGPTWYTILNIEQNIECKHQKPIQYL